MKHIAFDLGAESGRAIVGEIVNGRLEMNELHRFPTQGIFVNGSLRWDIYRLFAEIKTGLKKYAAAYGDEPCTMGVDTWGVDFGFLDKNGKLACIPYHYRDARNIGTSAIIDKKLGLDKLYDLTGVQQLQINSLNQLIAAKKEDDSVLEIADMLLFVGDILHYFLCGTAKSEHSISTTSNMYSTVSNSWSKEVLDAFGIEDKLMPDVLKPGNMLGTIRPELAEETGVNIDCKIIVPAVHDTASAVTAVPGNTDNIAFISSGTWSLAGLEMDKAYVSTETRKNNIANYGSSFDKILFIKNVMGLWLIQQSRKIWLQNNTELSYSEIVALADKAVQFYGFINPDDEVFLNPPDMPAEICKYLKKTNQNPVNKDNVGQIARIIFESLAFKYRNVFEKLEQVTGKQIDILNIIGGGIQNELLTQFTSDAIGIDVLAGPVEATAMGNILIQAYGSGEIKDIRQLRKIVRDTSNPKLYKPADKDSWDEMYKEYKKVCSI